MDTLTHALHGVLVATVVRQRARPKDDRAWLIAVALAGVFPDLDYLLIFYDPLSFLNLHRGPTHSLVLLPLWALLLSLPLSKLLKLPWRACLLACALGLFVHILGDWVTLYGTQLLYPLNDQPYALGVSFDINPWVAVMTVAGCLLVLIWRPRRSAGITLAMIAAVLVGQAALAREALAVAMLQARTQSLDVTAVRVLPQPISPFHWALLLKGSDGHRLAYLDLLAERARDTGSSFWLSNMMATYRPHDSLVWRSYAAPTQNALSTEAWSQPGFAAFRQFAQVPALIGIDKTASQACTWFTDLRHALPVIPSAFRYGLCREHGSVTWQFYQLPYFAESRRLNVSP